MAKIKKRYQKQYTVTDNTLIEDDRLSWKARGIFNYLWAKSDDWDFYELEVMKHATDGRDSLRTGLKELENFGYLKRSRARNSKGQVITSTWILSDTPMLKKPMCEKPTQVEATLPSTKEPSTNLTNSEEDEEELPIRQKVIAEFQKNIINISDGIVTEKLNQWITDMGPELVLKAIETGAYNSAHTFKYVNSTLVDWSRKNVKTVSDADELIKQHEKRNKTYSNKPKNRRGVEDEEYGW